MKVPRVCIIVLNWNGKELLKDCLSSLFKLTDYPNYKVIVVDNGSTDGSVEYVKKNFPKADVLALDKNYGFPKGNNKGIKYALKKYKPKYILLLNNDTKIVQRDWLKKLIETAESDEKIGVVGCKLLYPDKKIQFAGGSLFHGHIGYREYDKGQYDKICRPEFITGACFLIKKSLIDSIGLLDETLGPLFYEDVDYCIRAKEKGFKVIYNGFIKLVHKESVSARKVDSTFIKKRNELILALRYFPLSIILLRIAKSILSIFLKKKDKNLKTILGNISFRKDFFSEGMIFINALREALIYYKRYKIT
jgi:GT2 family glycosyltransferase